ncbi:hypothetical protein UFOVP806_48 [uncultured Caudovirales phage]|uniref:Uncharacterized protein n=1 Tax=uncultured Caudovirales phage TaxID=2100421 RepID=A0A6J5NXK1_9CAUD|nr:hypothetical protein UFOVP806_48 [uncultured Caudovirales phage]
MIESPFYPGEQPQRQPSPCEKLTDSILNLVAMHKEADCLENGECHAALVMAIKGLNDRLLMEDMASWTLPPRDGQYQDPELSA